MTPTTTPVDQAAEALAQAKAAEADARRKQLEATEARETVRTRVADGDDDVTGADLTDADQAAELADLRLEAATKRRNSAEKALHQAEVDRLRADVEAVLAGDGVERMSAQVEAVAEALADLIAEWRTQKATVDELVHRSVSLSPLPEDLKRDGSTLTWNSRPVSIPSADALVAALLGHVFTGHRLTVNADLGRAFKNYTGGYAGSVAHRYPLGAVLNQYATDRVFELAGKERWTE